MGWQAIPYVSNKRKTFNIIRLMATFLFFVGLIGFIVSFANLFHNWQALSDIGPCVSDAINDAEVLECKDYFYKTTGVPIGNTLNDANINIMVSFWPLAKLLFWLVVIFFSFFIYNIGNYWHLLTPKKDELPKYLETNYTSKTKK
jgi:hypothetical protein